MAWALRQLVGPLTVRRWSADNGLLRRRSALLDDLEKQIEEVAHTRRLTLWAAHVGEATARGPSAPVAVPNCLVRDCREAPHIDLLAFDDIVSHI